MHGIWNGWIGIPWEFFESNRQEWCKISSCSRLRKHSRKCSLYPGRNIHCQSLTAMMYRRLFTWNTLNYNENYQLQSRERCFISIRWEQYRTLCPKGSKKSEKLPNWELSEWAGLLKASLRLVEKFGQKLTFSWSTCVNKNLTKLIRILHFRYRGMHWHFQPIQSKAKLLTTKWPFFSLNFFNFIQK